MSIITLAGSPEQINQRLKIIKTDFISEHSDLAIETISNNEIELSEIIAIVSSLPFLAQRKLVIINDISHFQLAEEDLSKLLDSVAEEVELVFVEPNIDKRSKTYKLLSKETAYQELNPLKGSSLVDYVVKQAANLKLSMTNSDASYLIMQAGEDELRLKNELSKLAAAGKADKQSIDTLVEKQPTSKVFDLLDAAMNKNIDQAMNIYEEQRAQKVEPQSILGLLVWQLQMLALAKTSSNLEQTAKAADVKLYPLSRARSFTNRISYQKLLKLVEAAVESDIAIKKGANPDEAVKLLLAKLAY